MTTISRRELIRAADLTSRACKEHVEISPIYNGVRLRACSGLIGAEVVTPAVQPDWPPLCVSASQLLVILKGMASEEVDLSLEGNGDLRITGASEGFTVRRLSVRSVPWSQVSGVSLKLDGLRLKNAIERCLPACAANSGSYGQDGLYVIADGESLWLAATDNKRSHRCILGETAGNWAAPIPKSNAQLISRMLVDGDVELTLGDGNRLQVSQGKTVVFTPAMSGLPLPFEKHFSGEAGAVTVEMPPTDLADLAAKSMLIGDVSTWEVVADRGEIVVTSVSDNGTSEVTYPSFADGNCSIRVLSKSVHDAAACCAGSKTVTITFNPTQLVIQDVGTLDFLATIQGMSDE